MSKEYTLESIGVAVDGVVDHLKELNGKVALIDKWKERTQGATGVVIVVVTIFLGVFSWSLLTVVQLKSDVAKVQPDAIQAVVQQATADALKEVVLGLQKEAKK